MTLNGGVMADGVTIGPREIYDAVLALREDVLAMRGEIKNLRDDQDDHENRLRAMERTRWPLPSLALLISLMAVALPLIVK